MVLATHGTDNAGELIPASALGLSSIVGCTNAVKSDDLAIATATPSADGSFLLLTTSTGLTGTFLITVWGPPYNELN